LCLHASSHWKVYARPHAAALLRILDERPDLVRFWRTTFVPEESCAASILQSPALAGSIVEEVRDDLPWFIEWAGRRIHPEWLQEDHFGALERAAKAPPRRPDQPVIRASERDHYRKLFARKVSSREAKLLERIDEELREQPASGTPLPNRRAFGRETG